MAVPGHGPGGDHRGRQRGVDLGLADPPEGGSEVGRLPGRMLEQLLGGLLVLGHDCHRHAGRCDRLPPAQTPRRRSRHRDRADGGSGGVGYRRPGDLGRGQDRVDAENDDRETPQDVHGRPRRRRGQATGSFGRRL